VPELEAAAGQALARPADRKLLIGRFDPIGSVDLACSVEPVKSVRWHSFPRIPALSVTRLKPISIHPCYRSF